MEFQNQRHTIDHMTTLKECPETPNCVCSFFKKDEKHFIQPMLFYTRSHAEKAFAQLPSLLIEKYNATLLKTQANYFHFVCVTKIFRFKDDVEFLLDDCVIQIRSASRIGYSDLGTNRKRLESIRNDLKKAV
ncbi:MAG: DUF1499 domain-containing protein [Deltaproteobacteria bacterium]|nr:DUF1499 domain-containing protein [Deltaproteobacteria bacterium]